MGPVKHRAGMPRREDQIQLLMALVYHSVEYVLDCHESCYPQGLESLSGGTEIVIRNNEAAGRTEWMKRMG